MATTMRLIAKNVLGSDTATVTFDDIPGSAYTDLYIVASARSSLSAGNDDLYLRFNNSSATIYSTRHVRGDGTNTFSGSDSAQNRMYLLAIAANSTTASTFSSTEVYVPNYAGSTNKSISYTNLYENNATTAIAAAGAGLWASTSAITRVDLFTPSSNFRSGSSFFLYGITKA